MKQTKATQEHKAPPYTPKPMFDGEVYDDPICNKATKLLEDYYYWVESDIKCKPGLTIEETAKLTGLDEEVVYSIHMWMLTMGKC
jgi:hypothetical protein